MSHQCITYSRVSTEEQASEGHSLAVQAEKLRAYSHSNKWEIVAELADQGISARTKQRPALQDALLRLALGEAQTLVVTHLDRLSRSVKDTIGMIEQAKLEGWNVVFLDAGGTTVDTGTANGMLILHMMATIAQWKSDDTSERTKAGMAKAKADGHLPGDPRVTPPKLVKWMVRQYRAGYGPAEITRRLNARGEPTLRGASEWHRATVTGVLKRAMGDSYLTPTPSRRMAKHMGKQVAVCE